MAGHESDETGEFIQYQGFEPCTRGPRHIELWDEPPDGGDDQLLGLPNECDPQLVLGQTDFDRGELEKLSP